MKPLLKAIIIVIIIIIVIVAIAFVVYYFYKKSGGKIPFLSGLLGNSGTTGTGGTTTGGTTGGGTTAGGSTTGTISNAPPTGKTFPITSYGGSTSSSDNSAALLAAIKAANGTGTVVIPSGTFTITCTIISNSNNVAIYLMSGAVLQAPASQKDIKWDGDNRVGILTFNDCNGVSITGKGTIFGNGTTWWGPTVKKRDGQQGPHMMFFSSCKAVRVSGNTLLDTPYYNITFINTDNIIVSDCTIKTSNDNAPNSDGVHARDGVTNLLVTGVTFNTGEDAVAVNSIGNAASNITVTKCTLLSGHGLSIGSLVFGSISNVLFDNNTVTNCSYGCRIKCRSGRDGKGSLSNITYSNLTFKDITNIGIYVTTTYNANGTVLDANTDVTFKDCTFKNITGNNIKKGIIVDIESSKQLLTPMVFDTINFTSTGGGPTIVNTNNVPLKITNVKITS